MLRIVVWDIVPRDGHVPGNVRTLRRWAAVLHMRFVCARVAYADSFGYTHAQNASHVLHTRYGHEPIAHNEQ